MSGPEPRVWIAVKLRRMVGGPGAIQKVRVFDSYKALNAFLCPNTKRVPYRQDWHPVDARNSGYARPCKVYTLGDKVPT